MNSIQRKSFSITEKLTLYTLQIQLTVECIRIRFWNDLAVELGCGRCKMQF